MQHGCLIQLIHCGASAVSGLQVSDAQVLPGVAAAHRQEEGGRESARMVVHREFN